MYNYLQYKQHECIDMSNNSRPSLLNISSVKGGNLSIDERGQGIVLAASKENQRRLQLAVDFFQDVIGAPQVREKFFHAQSQNSLYSFMRGNVDKWKKDLYVRINDGNPHLPGGSSRLLNVLNMKFRLDPFFYKLEPRHSTFVGMKRNGDIENSPLTRFDDVIQNTESLAQHASSVLGSSLNAILPIIKAYMLAVDLRLSNADEDGVKRIFEIARKYGNEKFGAMLGSQFAQLNALAKMDDLEKGSNSVFQEEKNFIEQEAKSEMLQMNRNVKKGHVP